MIKLNKKYKEMYMPYEITPTVEGEEVPYKNPSPKFFEAVGVAQGMNELI
jgi:hypothetical protein